MLAASLEKVHVDGLMENLIFSLWLSDIDSQRGKDKLSVATKNLPSAPFLRVSIATYLLMRVYWRHSIKKDRLALLDAANDAIKPLGSTIKTEQIKRLIDKEAKEAGMSASSKSPEPRKTRR